jgi:iron complex transport system substrate-binding protein
VSQALSLLTRKPQILWLTPNSLEQIAGNLSDLGKATGRFKEAEDLIGYGRARLGTVAATTRNLSDRPRVFCMEWLDPVYCAGHWVPEMVELAGGKDGLSRPGKDSVRVSWDDVVKWAPEVLIVTPCGLNLEKSVAQARHLVRYPGWGELPAVRKGRAYAVDANSFFARPGPRVVDGTELLAHLIHPELFPWKGSQTAYQRLDFWAFDRCEQEFRLQGLELWARLRQLTELDLATWKWNQRKVWSKFSL